MQFYGNYGVWRRGWIDLSKGIFERLSNDDVNQLKYFMLRYKNPDKKKHDKEIKIPTDINSLYLYNYAAEPLQVNRKIMFTAAIIKYDLFRDNFNCIREIYLMNSNLRDDHIQLIANSLLTRTDDSKLEILTIHNNEFVTELYMPLLFRAIGTKAPIFRNLDISQTRCGDGVCQVILDFYRMYPKTKLSHINIENVLHIISENGMQKLESIIGENLISNALNCSITI